MRAIDANVLIRLVVRDDSDQTSAAERFVSPGAWVPHLALAETVWLLTSLYALDKDQVVAALEMLLDHAQLTIQDADVVAAALARFRRKAAPDFSDCLMLEIARKAGHLPLGTFDRSFAMLEGAERV
jgi:predicted nucleic-acid-binding protein